MDKILNERLHFKVKLSYVTWTLMFNNKLV